MAQIRLKNATGSTSKIGNQVKLVTGSKTSFVNANYWDLGIIGTVAQAVPNGNSCLIDLLGTINSTQSAYETVSKNLKSYAYIITYNGNDIDHITYNIGNGRQIVKTFNYTLGALTSLVLSGDTPSAINLTKTLHYTGSDLISVTYS